MLKRPTCTDRNTVEYGSPLWLFFYGGQHTGMYRQHLPKLVLHPETLTIQLPNSGELCLEESQS